MTYRDANGQPLDPSKLNLNVLQSKGALPDGLGQGFSLYVNAITQAPPPVPDSKVTLALGDTVAEAMNTIQLAGTDWNDAVKAYNTRRAQITGEIVTRVAVYFGFDLPVTFPYYQGGNAGQPIQNSLATQKKQARWNWQKCVAQFIPYFKGLSLSSGSKSARFGRIRFG